MIPVETEIFFGQHHRLTLVGGEGEARLGGGRYPDNHEAPSTDHPRSEGVRAGRASPKGQVAAVRGAASQERESGGVGGYSLPLKYL